MDSKTEMETKRTVYIMLSMCLGFLMGLLFLIVLQTSFYSSYIGIVKAGSCQSCMEESFLAGSPIFAAFMGIAGLAGGFLLGQSWWKMVYVDKKRWSLRKLLGGK